MEDLSLAFSALLVLYPTIDLDIVQHCDVCGFENKQKMRGISEVKSNSNGKILVKMKQSKSEIEVLDVDAYCSALVDTEENHVQVTEKFPERCDSNQCYSSLEIAEILGCVVYQSDDVDTKQQYISNTCTGMYRQYENWRFPIKTETKLWSWLCLKKQCIKCGIAHDEIKKQKPYCADCFQSLLQTKKSKFQQLKIETGLKERRLKFEFVKSFPVHSAEQDFCSACFKSKSQDYKPVFYYGYKAICSECVFREKKDGPVLASLTSVSRDRIRANPK